jgi:DNA-binding CsgD family transcriptional regulator
MQPPARDSAARDPVNDCWVVEAGEETYALFIFGSALDLSPLTISEAQVTRLAMDGLSNAEIARRRGVSTRTVVNQLTAIYPKLGVGSRRELKALARGAAVESPLSAREPRQDESLNSS